MEFSKAQEEAIVHKDGPMLVFAGPGAGKTRVITERTRYLIEEHGVHPGEILVITFTRAAAAEMSDRFKARMEGLRVPVTFGTFHGVFFNILKAAYGYRAEHILKEEQKHQIFRELIEREELELDDEQEFMASVISEVSTVKTNRIRLEHYYSMNCPEEIFKHIYEGYEKRLREAGLIDFDDMLVFCYELFAQRPDILQGWQQKFRYIMVDEGQDINGIQYEVTKQLAGDTKNLFIVGDDDQSIYRFRGAKPDILLNFTKDFEDARTVVLDRNYRCSRRITESAGRVIKNNENRYPKKIVTENPAGPPVTLKQFKKQDEENEAVISWIREYRDKGIPYAQMAVLYRTNIDPRQLVTKCMEYNIPFRIQDSLPNIYEHWITRNILSYIRIAMGSRDRRQFLQIANRPNRYINRECLELPQISFDQMREYYKEKTWMQERIDEFEGQIHFLAKTTPYTAVNFIRNGIGYEEYLEEYAKFRRINPEELIDVLDELEESAKKYKTYEEWFQHMADYKEELQRQSRQQRQQHDSVAFSTMHSAKGLEYEAVFIIDANEGITPHKKAVKDADMEEERRLFYVAMTRAKTYLHITWITEKFHKKLETSRFVGEILLDKEELQPGVAVVHKKYKDGVVKARDGDKVKIYFEKPGRILTLDINYCMTDQLLEIKRMEEPGVET